MTATFPSGIDDLTGPPLAGPDAGQQPFGGFAGPSQLGDGQAPLNGPPTGPPTGPPLEPSSAPPPRPPRGRTLPAALAGGAVGAVVAGLVAFATVQLADDPSPTTPASITATTTANRTVSLPSTSNGGAIVGQALDIHALIAKVEPSVVSVEIGAQTRSGAVQAVAAGSGVVISDDGLILTNAHVVDLTDSFGRSLTNPVITVKLADGTTREAKVLGSEPAKDIALIQVSDTSGLKAATLGDSEQLQVGDDVVAIGNALDLGDSPTVTKGIVSAKDRTLTVDANTTLEGLIQTDAPINHGNSGGALVNAAGEVIGINSAGIPDAQNVGFAIAINTVKPLIDELRAGGANAAAAGSGGSAATTGQTVAYLGVSTSQTSDGVTVTGVTAGSAAEKAGLRAGDVITAIGTTKVTTTTELGSALRSHKPGDVVNVTVQRNGASETVTAQLGARSQ